MNTEPRHQPMGADIDSDFAKRLRMSQQDLPEEAARILRENLWGLYGEDKMKSTKRWRVRQVMVTVMGKLLYYIIVLALWSLAFIIFGGGLIFFGTLVYLVIRFWIGVL